MADAKEEIELEPSTAVKFLCLKMKVWWLIVSSILGVILIFMLGCLASTDWVVQGSGSDEWTGSLLFCIDCADRWNYDSYPNLADRTCNVNLDGWCDLFEALTTAGRSFVFFEVLSFISIVLWMHRIAMMQLQMRFGPNWLNFVFPATTLLFHFLAGVIWAGVTKAKFSGSCDETVEDDRPDVCSTQGPSIALLVALLLLIVTPMYILLYIKRHGPKPEHEEENPNKA